MSHLMALLAGFSAWFTFVAAANAQQVQTAFHFRMPQAAAFSIPSVSLLSSPEKTEWLKASLDNGSTNLVEFGRRVVLQLRQPDDLKHLTEQSSLELSRIVTSNVFILQAPDALTAMREADHLASLPEVLASYPVLKRYIQPDGLYALRSNDPFFVPYFNENPSYDSQWPMENRDYDTAARLGIDLNVLAAWPYSKGQGVTVAVADGGLEVNHPELTNRMVGAPHFNFGNLETNPAPLGGGQFDPNVSTWTHGTSVAGLIVAEADNGIGMAGVAPLAHLAGWVIFETNTALVPDDRLLDMYQYASDIVSIQNHSWGAGNFRKDQAGPTLLEQIGIANAVTLGRNGLGTIMVRSAGNDRSLLASAEDDAYPDDPQAIAVAAVDKSGRATGYSEPGACVLVGAPGGGGPGEDGLFALDLLGSTRGVNMLFYQQPDLADYRWGSQGFMGTSAAAPLVSGIAALMLSANPNLGYRDVQQILVLSAHQYDLTDPDLVRNGAGFLVSHNVGFGVPDAGEAVRLAIKWPNRPPLTTVSVTDSRPFSIPDDSLRVETTGGSVPPELTSIRCQPSIGPHADDPTPWLPLVDVGLATNVPAVDLTNKGALILRGGATFADKIKNAAAAGAAYAVIYNAAGDESLFAMLQTDYVPIPAVFIGNSNGEALKALFLTNAAALCRIHLQSADRVFHVGSSLLCEQVGVRVQLDHPSRGDLRITLLSPQGTRSLLQRINDDVNPANGDWTYWSTHHFFESSAGDWTVSFGDERADNTGTVHSVSFIIRGTQITDTDTDGLDDHWENNHFSSLAQGPKDDPDSDGYSNSREQLMGTDPNFADVPFELDLSPWRLFTTRRVRLSWPSSTNSNYEIWAGESPASLSVLTNLPGRFPETDWMTTYSEPAQRFFRVLSSPNP